jgi:hypothetical protein
MPHKILCVHNKIVNYTIQALKGWVVKREYKISSKCHARADVLAFKPDLQTALVIEAKAEENNKAISGGVGQLLFYKEVFDLPKIHSVLFALALPGRVIDAEYNHKTKGFVNVEPPKHGMVISNEAWKFAQRHEIGILSVADDQTVNLMSKVPLGLWLLMKQQEDPK